MKKSVITAILLMIAFIGFSQIDTTIKNLSKTDTAIIPVPRYMVNNAIRAKDSLEIMKGELSLGYRLISMYEKLAIKDSVIAVKNDSLIAVNGRMILNLSNQNDNIAKQKVLTDNINASLRSMVRKKNFVIAGLVALLGGSAYLLLK